MARPSPATVTVTVKAWKGLQQACIVGATVGVEAGDTGVAAVAVPQQTNAYDCGIHMLLTVRAYYAPCH